MLHGTPKSQFTNGFCSRQETNCYLLSASLLRINIDFSSDFHIPEIRKKLVYTAWILDLRNRLHCFLDSALWTRRKLLTTHELFMQKTI
jgi:hypothetical protein